MKTNYTEIENRLEKEGWEFSHQALVNHYVYAGRVSDMKPRKGFEYCRLHIGKCVGRYSWQITYVYKRPVQG